MEITLLDLLKFDTTEFLKLPAENQLIILEALAYNWDMVDSETGVIDISDVEELKLLVRLKFAEWLSTRIKDVQDYKRNRDLPYLEMKLQPDK